jgi:hypothetical protein
MSTHDKINQKLAEGLMEIHQAKSTERTKQGRSVNVRLTPSEYSEYQRLGGVKWFRMFLRMSAASVQQKQVKGQKK